jgi:chromosomal replication initiator protein
LAELFQTQDGPGRLGARNRLAEHRYLFMDDLPGLDNYPGLADELLILVNMFALNKYQMVFTSSKPLADCDGLPGVLRARLEGGLTVQLSKPDLDVRVKFVQDHCQRKSIGLTKAQMLTLAQRHADFRTLTGMLNKFQAYRELLKRDISDSIFENILGHGQGVARPKLSPQTIIYTVAKRFKLDPQDITGHSRKKGVVLARQTAMLLCREELGLSYPALGKLFGGKDHSTVLYSIKKVVKIQIDDQHMKQFIQEMRLSCRQER